MSSCKTSGMLRRQLGLLDSANEGIMILRNVIKYLPVDTAQISEDLNLQRFFFLKTRHFLELIFLTIHVNESLADALSLS